MSRVVTLNVITVICRISLLVKHQIILSNFYLIHAFQFQNGRHRWFIRIPMQKQWNSFIYCNILYKERRERKGKLFVGRYFVLDIFVKYDSGQHKTLRVGLQVDFQYPENDGVTLKLKNLFIARRKWRKKITVPKWFFTRLMVLAEKELIHNAVVPVHKKWFLRGKFTVKFRGQLRLRPRLHLHMVVSMFGGTCTFKSAILSLPKVGISVRCTQKSPTSSLQK